MASCYSIAQGQRHDARRRRQAACGSARTDDCGPASKGNSPPLMTMAGAESRVDDRPSFTRSTGTTTTTNYDSAVEFPHCPVSAELRSPADDDRLARPRQARGLHQVDAEPEIKGEPRRRQGRRRSLHDAAWRASSSASARSCARSVFRICTQDAQRGEGPSGCSRRRAPPRRPPLLREQGERADPTPDVAYTGKDGAARPSYHDAWPPPPARLP